jgi:hypothetical protein
VTLFPAGRQRVTSWWIRDPADFCRKMRAVFGAEVYRNSTGVSVLEKSAGKKLIQSPSLYVDRHCSGTNAAASD